MRQMDSKNLLIQGAYVVAVDDRHTEAALDIRIQSGRITEMAPHLRPGAAEVVVAAKGLVAMPGLVQAHVHTCQTLARSQADDVALLDWLRHHIWPMEAALDPVTLRAAARLGMTELLLGGTTSILDMGTVHHTDVLFEQAAALGMRYTGGKTIMDDGEGYPDGLREAPKAALTESHRLCRAWHGQQNGRLRYAYSPRFAVCCSREVLEGCVHGARQHGALLHTHASENRDEVALVRARTGCDNVAYLHGLGFTGPDVVLAHGIWMTAEERALVKQTGTRIVHCPSSNLKLASGIAPIDAYLAEGIEVAIGADGAPCGNNLDGFLEMRLTALLHKPRGGATVVPARQALRMATRGGALALGLQDCGHIVVGARADIILLDLHKPHLYPAMGDLTSRLVYAAQRSDVHSVICDGQVVVAEGALMTGQVTDIMAEAQAAAAVLQGRVPGWLGPRGGPLP